jgi:hypothetical protein
MNTREWHLSVSSYRGLVSTASHYYATLQAPCFGQRHEVTHRLTKEEAASLSVLDDYQWRAGESTIRFNTREDSISAAIVLWRTLANSGDYLALGWDEGEILATFPEIC